MASSALTPNNVSFVFHNIESVAPLYDTNIRLFLFAFWVRLLMQAFATAFPSHLFPDQEVLTAPGVKLTEDVTARLSYSLVKKKWSDHAGRINVEYDNMIVLK